MVTSDLETVDSRLTCLSFAIERRKGIWTEEEWAELSSDGSQSSGPAGDYVLEDRDERSRLDEIDNEARLFPG